MSKPREGIEILVPSISDAIFKYTWHIKKYDKMMKKKDTFDSAPFEYNANGDKTKWNLSIRYWTGPQGKRLKNPVVLCLNLLSSQVRHAGQVRIKFQFGIYNNLINQWEQCPPSRTVLNMENTESIISIGYSDIMILDRHIDKPRGNVQVFVKIQLASTEYEVNSLNQDLSRLLSEANETGDVVIKALAGKEIKAHKCILSARSRVLTDMCASDQLDFSDFTEESVQELLHYIYTDRADLESNVSDLLTCSDRYFLPGLKTMCERFLIETISPERIPSLLLIADEYQCDELKKCALEYCENNANAIQKSMAWKVLESTNPELFDEVCEAGLGSSISSNLDSSDPDF